MFQDLTQYDRPKIQRFDAGPTLLKQIQDFFKMNLDLVGFTYVLR